GADYDRAVRFTFPNTGHPSDARLDCAYSQTAVAPGTGELSRHVIELEEVAHLGQPALLNKANVIGVFVVALVRGAICELHRYPVAVTILRAHFGQQLERLDARNACEVLRGLEEVTLFRRPWLMDECERNGVSDAAGDHS